MDFGSVEELRGAVGTHLGYSGWRTITQKQVNAFADATDDHQWIHVDPGRAASGPYGATIAHGYLTLALLPGLLAEIYRIHNVAMEINYGADRVRFPVAVPVGSEVRAGAELIDSQPASAGERLTLRVTVERRDSDKPACVADVLVLVVAT